MSDPDIGRSEVDTTLSFRSFKAIDEVSKLIRELEIKNREIEKENSDLKRRVEELEHYIDLLVNHHIHKDTLKRNQQLTSLIKKMQEALEKALRRYKDYLRGSEYVDEENAIKQAIEESRRVIG